MKTPYFPLLIALGATLAWLPAAAEKGDRDKPMNVEADALRYDDKQKTSSFTGRVVVSQGSILMRGERLDVRQDAAGNQVGTLSGASGGRAFFRQKRDGLDEYIEAEGEVIEYDAGTDSVRFSRRAELRRLRGSALVDRVAGGEIVYNNASELFTVDGADPHAAAVPAQTPGGGRVRAMLAPRTGVATPAQSPASAPPLRPSTQLGGGRK